jgi:hypothetical protein
MSEVDKTSSKDKPLTKDQQIAIGVTISVVILAIIIGVTVGIVLSKKTLSSFQASSFIPSSFSLPSFSSSFATSSSIVTSSASSASSIAASSIPVFSLPVTGNLPILTAIWIVDDTRQQVSGGTFSIFNGNQVQIIFPSSGIIFQGQAFASIIQVEGLPQALRAVSPPTITINNNPGFNNNVFIDTVQVVIRNDGSFLISNNGNAFSAANLPTNKQGANTFTGSPPWTLTYTLN